MANTVSNNWLVKVNVSLNLATTALPAFNNCMVMGVFSNTYKPSSFGSAIYNSYANYAALSADFSAQQTTAIGAGDLLQGARLGWLLDDANAFFEQLPTPNILYVAQILPEHISVPNYTTIFTNITAAQNNFYGCTISDLILPGGATGYSQCIVSLTSSGASTIPAGTVVTPETASASYTLLQAWELPSTGTYLVPFYSTDGTTAIASGTFTAISPSIATITTVTNATPAINAIPGFTTPSSGIDAGLFAMRTANNIKAMFADTLDPTVAQSIQTAGGSVDLAIFYGSLNLQAPIGFVPTSIPNKSQYAAANLGEYFTDLFAVGVGMKPISSMQLTGQPTDPAVNGSNIGTPGQTGSSTNLIGWNNNVYAGFGAPPGIGLMQYGYTSNSTANNQVYIDEKVGADYLQSVAQAAIVDLIVNSQPTGGLLYNDFGIQQIVSTFKGAAQQAVNQNILQPINNADFVYLTYAQTLAQTPAQVAARQYNNLTFNGEFLSRIQTITVQVNLSL